jgi:transposase
LGRRISPTSAGHHVQSSKVAQMNLALSATATNWREGRRLRAWELHEQGWRQSEIAAALGVTSGAVCQWMRRVRDGGGPEALRRRKAPGGRPRLSTAQQSQVLGWLREGAEAHGFRGDLWTRKRVAVLIERNLGIRYHPGHVSKLLQSWKWSSQKPEQRARQRDEAAIEQWVKDRWPAIKKEGHRGGAHSALP